MRRRPGQPIRALSGYNCRGLTRSDSGFLPDCLSSMDLAGRLGLCKIIQIYKGSDIPSIKATRVGANMETSLTQPCLSTVASDLIVSMEEQKTTEIPHGRYENRE